VGVSGDGDYKKYYADLGITADRETLYEIFLPAYRAYTSDLTEVTVFPGVHETLYELRQRGVEIHILTAAHPDLAGPIVDVIDIRHFCSGFHAHVHNKHAQIHTVLAGMDIHPSECAMMGDVPSDVIHARRAGIKGVGFMNPDVPRELFEGVDVDYMALCFSDVLDLW